MDRWKSRGGKSQRREEKRREEKRRRKTIKKRKSQKNEDPGARKGRKVVKHCVFPMVCGSRVSKSRLAKAAGAEPSGQMRDGKLHAVVARSQNVQNTPTPDRFWKLRCRKSARHCGVKHISKSKCTKHIKTRHSQTIFWEFEKVHAIVAWSTFPSQNAQNTSKHAILRPFFGSLKKCTPLWREAHFQVKMYKTHHIQSIFASRDVRKKRTPLWREARFEVKIHKTHQRRTAFGSWDVQKVYALVARSTFPSQKCKKPSGTKHFWTLRCCFALRAQGTARLVKVSKTWKFSSISRNDGRRGTFEEDLERCIFRGRRSTGDMFTRDGRRVRELISGEGLHFGASDRQVCEDDFAWQVQHFVWLGINFSWQAQYFRDMDSKNRKLHWHEAISSALNFLLSKEVSQNFFVFDVANFKNCGSLAGLLRFQTCRKTDK